MGYWWVICHRIYHNKSWVWSLQHAFIGEKYDGRKSPMGYWRVICHRIYHNKSWVWSPFIGEKYDGQKSPMGY